MDRECPYDVFISHSSRDKSICDAVCASLEAARIRCWVAPRDILPGMEWGESIVEAINLSKIMVIIFSSNSNNSKQVAREVESAVRKGLQIIPFRIEDINPTGSMEYYLYTQHWMDAITPPMQHHIDGLVKAVKEYLEPKELKEPNPDKVVISDNLKKRSPIVNPLFLGLAVLCIVGAVIAGSLLLKGMNNNTNQSASIENANDKTTTKANPHTTINNTSTDITQTSPAPKSDTSNPIQNTTNVGNGSNAAITSSKIVFNDAKLEAVIRGAIGKPTGDITPDDVQGIRILNAANKGISNISALKYLVNLEELHLEENRLISDLTPLKNLTKLKVLYCYSNKIKDVSPLKGLVNLQKLYMCWNDLNDISPLSGLTNLQELSFGDMNITNVSPLRNLKKLRILRAYGNQIHDISPLSGLTNLQELDLSGNPVSDYGPISGLNIQNLRK